ncbi:hypothetical protein ABZ297_14025 [Nonomuraea sp. NPDC005983]|uniref:hypothetical protein n=1 Tax=Nonomuraea sp. NPDC005983 TaxID=3155595 RepID=UPI0033A6B51E
MPLLRPVPGIDPLGRRRHPRRAPTELRARMGVLFQDYMSYDLTAAENIGVGDIEALTDRGRVETAARAAGARDIVRTLPCGYDTMSRVFFGPEDEDPQAG